MKRLFKSLKITLAVALGITLLSGCGSRSLSESYPLESVTQNGPESSRVYRAENKTVPQVAQELAEQRKPLEISKEDPERMFLIYSDEWYHLQRDPQKPSDTLIEVDSKEFVRQNYNPSFLEGYILANLIDDLFDTYKRYPGTYRGYTSKDIYKPNVDYRTPTPQEKKTVPPITVERSGSIIKRSDKPLRGNETSVGSSGSIIKKESGDLSPSTNDVGKITRSSGENSGTISGDNNTKSNAKFAPPRNNSPPKTKVGGSGKITRRR